MAWNDGLTRPQEFAASHWGSSARVLSGPGTGKTRALIQRIAYLIQERNIDPEQIITITFTRAAAKELRERLIQQLGISEAEMPNVRTLHSFALKTLLQHRAQSGIQQPLQVADDFEEQHVLFPEIGSMIGQSVTEVERALKAYEATWNTLEQDHEAWRTIDFRRDFETALRVLSGFYSFTLRAELVYRLLRLLEGNPLIGEDLQLRHVLVDEYQDLNYCDQRAVELLEEFGARLFVVGDDDQSIYEFRHAYPDGIRRFTNGRSNCGDYPLNVCHRCPERVVQYAAQLIGWDRERIARDLHPAPSAITGDVVALQFGGHAQEADGIAEICLAYIDAGTLQPQDIAILLSRRNLAKRIVQALEERNIPASVLVPVWPLGGREEGDHTGRLIYCELRLLIDRQDALAARTWLGLQRGVGPQTISYIREHCLSHQLSFWDGVSSISAGPSVVRSGRVVKARFDCLVELLDSLQSIESLDDILDRLIGPAEANPDAAKAEVRQYLDHIIAEEEVEGLPQLVHVLQTLDLQAESSLSENAVRVMTMHKAKGLSAELVIIPALEQDLMPGNFGEPLARRMMYVSMTRSRRTLILTHALTRTGSQSYLGSGQGQSSRQRSQFLAEIEIRSQSGPTYIKRLQATLPASSSLVVGEVNTAVLRQLLIEAFSDEEIITLCFDYFLEVYEQFGTGMSKTVKVHRLIEHCTRRLELDRLLSLVRERNSSQYEHYEAQIRTVGGNAA